jgi:hypothetical protein
MLAVLDERLTVARRCRSRRPARTWPSSSGGRDESSRSGRCRNRGPVVITALEPESNLAGKPRARRVRRSVASRWRLAATPPTSPAARRGGRTRARPSTSLAAELPASTNPGALGQPRSCTNPATCSSPSVGRARRAPHCSECSGSTVPSSSASRARRRVEQRVHVGEATGHNGAANARAAHRQRDQGDAAGNPSRGNRRVETRRSHVQRRCHGSHTECGRQHPCGRAHPVLAMGRCQRSSPGARRVTTSCRAPAPARFEAAPVKAQATSCVRLVGVRPTAGPTRRTPASRSIGSSPQQVLALHREPTILSRRRVGHQRCGRLRASGRAPR